MSVTVLLRGAALAASLVLAASAASANATIPTRDIAGAKDSALLKRYEGSFIVGYERSAFTEFRVPLGKLEVVAGEKDTMNNVVIRPKEAREVEGSVTRLVYVLPAERSPLEVLRNYQDEIEAAGGKLLWSCKQTECGGDDDRSSSGGGGTQSLMMYFIKSAELKDKAYSNGACALTSGVVDQRFLAAEMPVQGGQAHVTVQTFQLKDDLYCKALNGRTIALVHVVEPRARERKMTLVRADEMSRSIGKEGKIALYGIFFDFDKAELKPESAPTLQEIATLLKAEPKLAVIIVGHTDNQGGFEYNLDLSRRRAEAVVRALATQHGIEQKRLRSSGVGMVAPAASNDGEEGRAKNRRVELVKLN